MVNEAYYGMPSFNPMAMGAYQQFLQNYQQQNVQQDGNLTSPIQDNGFSLVTPDGQTQPTTQQQAYQNSPYMYNNYMGFSDLNSVFSGTDVYKSQILASKPWEKYTAQYSAQQPQGQTQYQGQYQQTQPTMQGVSFTI